MIGLVLEPGTAKVVDGSLPFLKDFEDWPLNEQLDVGGTGGVGL
jgi:hypothetical protein